MREKEEKRGRKGRREKGGRVKERGKKIGNEGK